MTDVMFDRRMNNVKNPHKKSSIRECIGNIKHRYEPLRVVSKILLLYGLDLTGSPINSRKKNILIWFGRTFVISVYIFVFFVNLRNFPTNAGTKVIMAELSKGVLDFNGIILWFVLNKAGKRIPDLIENVEKFSNYFDVKPSMNSQTFPMIWLILIQFGIPLHFLYAYDKKISKKFLTWFFISRLNDVEIICIYYCITFLYVSLAYTFPSCFVVLYLVLCNRVKNVIQYYSKKIVCTHNHAIAHNSFFRCIGMYRSIITTLRSFDSIMSFAIFVVLSCNVLGIFFGLTFFLKVEAATNTRSIVVLLYNFVTFALITIFASKVNTSDAFAKQVNTEALQKTPLCTGSAELDIKVRFLDTGNESPFALSAWGFFHFTSSFFFVALGSIITYILLIINLRV